MCICIGAHTTYKLASTLGLNFLVLPITYLGDPELFSLVFCDCSGTFGRRLQRWTCARLLRS